MKICSITSVLHSLIAQKFGEELGKKNFFRMFMLQTSIMFEAQKVFIYFSIAIRKFLEVSLCHMTVTCIAHSKSNLSKTIT